MYSLVSHIAVDGASVMTYRMKTRRRRDRGCAVRGLVFAFVDFGLGHGGESWAADAATDRA